MSVALPGDCGKVREQLPEYAEGALAGGQRRRLERHLASCQRCAQEVSDLRVVIAAVRSVAPDETAEDLIARVRSAVRQQAPAPAAPRLFWPRLAVPVAVLTGLVAISFALRAPRQVGFAPSSRMVPAPEAAEIRVKQVAPSPALGAAGGAGGGRAGRAAAKPSPAALPETITATIDAAFGEQKESAARKPAQVVEHFPSERAHPVRGRPPGGAPGGWEDGTRGAGGLQDTRPAGRAGGSRPADELGMMAPMQRTAAEAQMDRAEERQPVARDRELAAKAEATTLSPVFARAALVKGQAGPIIALEVASTTPTDTVSVRLGDHPAQVYQWQSAGSPAAIVPLPADALGAGPTAIKVEISSSAGKRYYMLFAPIMARLGETAPAAPVARYQGTPLGSVLADFAAFTGAVVLAELPLDVEVNGQLPGGLPEASLRELAAGCGFEVSRKGDSVFTLIHRR